MQFGPTEVTKVACSPVKVSVTKSSMFYEHMCCLSALALMVFMISLKLIICLYESSCKLAGATPIENKNFYFGFGPIVLLWCSNSCFF